MLAYCKLLKLGQLSPERFTSPVISFLDGDTIEVPHNTHPERVRLSGIDCPEKGQDFGTRAKQAASALVFGKDVMLQTHGQDKYVRTLADVFLRDGTYVNHALVKEGWCWWYRKYAPGDSELKKLEKDARNDCEVTGSRCRRENSVTLTRELNRPAPIFLWYQPHQSDSVLNRSI